MLELLEPDDLDTHPHGWSGEALRDQAIAPLLLAGDDLRALARLRYDFFVARDGKAYPHADHQNRLLLEPIDRDSLNFGIVRDGQCLVGVRLTRATKATTDPQMAAVLSRHSDLDPNRVALNSRLTVAPTGQIYIPAVFRQVYRTALLSGADYGLVAARPVIAPLFQRFGYVASNGVINDPIAGPLLTLRLPLRDVNHMRSTRSPLLRPLLEYLASLER